MLDHSTSLGSGIESVEASTLLTELHSEKKYKCPQCSSSFKRPENLKRHQRGHDESRRFMCHICDKSFARSDILGRHVAIHMPLEQRNDNPQRKRACRECARARERCSRGSPCRRCTIKSLCCLYPEEHPFNTMTPHAWSSSTSESSDYEATCVSRLGPQLPLQTTYTARDTLLQGPEPSQWQAEGSSVGYGGPSIHSALPHTQFHPYQSDHHEHRFASSFRHSGLSLLDTGPYPGSISDINTDETRFMAGDAELGGMLGAYEQTINMPFDLISSNRMDFHQDSPCTEFQDHHIRSPPLDSRHLDTPFNAHCTDGLNSGFHTDILSQHGTLNGWNTPRSYECLASSQAPPVDVDGQETLFQFVQNPSYPI